jgi:hypothetical protein
MTAEAIAIRHEDISGEREKLAAFRADGADR